MLSTIRSFWPPNPSPQEPQTGTKTVHVPGTTTITETLKGLHKPAWWTGLHISRLTVNDPELLYRVRLLRGNGDAAFDAVPHLCEWVQTGRQVVPFPWPIPAVMATELNLSVEITQIDSGQQSDLLGIVLTFHELPDEPRNERYLFVTTKGAIVQYWNGGTLTHGNQRGGDEPRWRTLHSIVPPMTRLLSPMPWDSRKPFCAHEWEELVPMY